MTVDLLLAEGSLIEVWQDREVHALTTCEVCVVSREGLRQMKLAAGRRKDLDDLEHESEEPDGSS